MIIFCAICDKDQDCRKATGAEIYPHREDLHSLIFWVCPRCGGYVGTHNNSKKNAPLGIIVSPKLKIARQEIHKILDPIWKSKKMNRKKLYAAMSETLGWQYHTAMIRTIEEARKVYKAVRAIILEYNF